jgi:hypothetical protein
MGYLINTEIQEVIMNTKYNALLVVIFLICFGIASVGWISATTAGVYREEFKGNDLDKNLWEVKAEGNASYVVKDGNLTMTSPDVADGILIYWKGGDISKEDFSFEIKATVDPNTDNAALIAFIRKELPPTLNTTINAEWKNMFWCGKNTPGWYINDDNWKSAGVNGPEFEGTWKAEITGNDIICYFNGEEVVTVDKIKEKRFVCFGPDTYTSHYLGAMTIDWIELSGPTVTAAAVQSAEKLPITWGMLKGKS